MYVCMYYYYILSLLLSGIICTKPTKDFPQRLNCVATLPEKTSNTTATSK